MHNKYSGTFIAPVSGMYVFSSSIVMDGTNNYASFQIMKNSDIEGTFFVDAEYDNGFQYSSITIVIALQIGDAVFVRTSASYTPHGSILSYEHAYCTFSGWLIRY